MIKKISNLFLFALVSIFVMGCEEKVGENTTVITINGKQLEQTMDNFGGSDAWSTQFVGLWNDRVREQVAERLFSQEFDADGNPQGIGLSVWRFNIGAGSAEQGDQANIGDPYRRAECFMDADGKYDFSKQAGQRWFLQAAKRYGVEQFIAFLNSPPVHLTKNGRANCSEKGVANIAPEHFARFADFMTESIDGLAKQEGITFDYISPMNEPQWEWMGGQEGSYMDNKSFAGIVRELDKALRAKDMSTRILIPETAQYDFLYERDEKTVGHQIDHFWGKGENSLAELTTLAPIVGAHAYFSNWPLKQMLDVRGKLCQSIAKYPQLKFWQTEYCILGGHEGIKASPRNLSIDLGLYVTRLMHFDIVAARAAAWQWWVTISPYDYNDGLVFVNDKDSTLYDAKITWAFGNFSRFIRPGSIRLGLQTSRFTTYEEQENGVMVTAYRNNESGKVSVVAINYSDQAQPIRLRFDELKVRNLVAYETSEEHNLSNLGEVSIKKNYELSARSITTFYGDIK